MSDVTAEEIEREMPAAWEAVKSGLAGQTLATTFARALATVRKEARRDALGEAMMALENVGEHSGQCCRHLADDEKAIRALMGPGT